MLLGALSVVGSLGACQAPPGATTFHYGDARAVSVRSQPEPRLVSLVDSLEPLRKEFDSACEVPRVIALLPHVHCERGAELLREHVLDAYPTDDLRLFVIWQDIARSQRMPAAAARVTENLSDRRVVGFHDGEGRAGRAFARGKLPVAEAREVFLFYPAGLRWPTSERPKGQPGGRDVTPDTEQWVHQFGRVSPERFCSPKELPGAMREAVKRLVEQARAREAARADTLTPADRSTARLDPHRG